MDNIQSFLNLSSFLNLNKGKSVRPTWDVNFWEYAYELEVRKFISAIEKKCFRLKKLKAIDLFLVPQEQASTTVWQINSLTEEVTNLYGIKLFMDDLKTAYLDSSVRIFDTYKTRQLRLEMENHHLKIENAYESASSQLYLDLAINATEKIIQLKK